MLSTEHRVRITRDQVDKGIAVFRHELFKRLDQKGYGTFTSCHEILGVITEEIRELEDAIRTGKDGEYVGDELMDVAVGAVFGYICMREGTVDW